MAQNIPAPLIAVGVNQTAPITDELLAEIINNLVPTGWEKPESLGAKVEEGAAKNFAARTEVNGAVCRLRGALKIKAGQELKAGETLCTLPLGYRPPAAVVLSAAHGEAAAGAKATANLIEVTAAGVVKVTTAVKEGEIIYLDGEQFSLT